MNTDYKELYLTLFNDVSDAIKLLQQAQEKTEELYALATDGEVVTLRAINEPED